jgi:outer membrane cobalamin receptor
MMRKFGWAVLLKSIQLRREEWVPACAGMTRRGQRYAGIWRVANPHLATGVPGRCGHLPGTKPAYQKFRVLIYFVYLAVLLVAASACGQDFVTISGQVTDSLSGEPLGGVIVTAIPDGVSSITDATGHYRLLRLTPGQIKLQVSSSFHQDKQSGVIFCREGDSHCLDIVLTPLILTGSPQEVRATPPTSPGVTAFGREELASSQSTDVGGFLREQGYYTQGDGRNEYLVLRGSLPEGVLVLVDGRAINPDGGAADLRQIPLGTVERVEVYTSAAAAKFGANALGGAVSVVSRQLRQSESGSLCLTTSRGDYNLAEYGIFLEQAPYSGLRLLADYQYSEGSNDYSYEHPYLGEIDRQNNFARRYAVYSRLNHRALPTLSLSARAYNTHTGIPGAVLQESPGAISRRAGQLVNLDFTQANFQVRAGWGQLSQSLADSEPLAPYDLRYLQSAREIEAHWRRRLQNAVELEFGSHLKWEDFYADDLSGETSLLPTVERQTRSAFGAAMFSHNRGAIRGSAQARWRYDRLDDQEFNSPYLGLSLDWQREITVGVEVSYGESFRVPPLDALFWQESVFAIGNPNLKPETAINREWGILVRKRGSRLD